MRMHFCFLTDEEWMGSCAWTASCLFKSIRWVLSFHFFFFLWKKFKQAYYSYNYLKQVLFLSTATSTNQRVFFNFNMLHVVFDLNMVLLNHLKKKTWIATNIDLTLNHCATVFQEKVNLKACHAYFKVHLPMAVRCAKMLWPILVLNV